MAATALAQKSDAIEVPGWVPPEYRETYCLIGAAKGEEDAASIVRRLKVETGEAAWTPTRVATLLRMWLDGASSGKIAAAIGDGVTRNAVIGKKARLGLTSDAPRGRRPSIPTVTRPTRIVSTRGPALLSAPPKPVPPARPVPPFVDEPAEPPIPGGVELLDLEYHHCRFPVADGPPLRFCGARKPDGAPAFCKAHAQRAYAGRAAVPKAILRAAQR